jgi:flagellar motor switch/type III secretory pathway protein FliN
VSAEESLQRAEELLDRLDASRKRLAETENPDEAIEILAELSQIAKDVEAELGRAKMQADAES